MFLLVIIRKLQVLIFLILLSAQITFCAAGEVMEKANEVVNSYQGNDLSLCGERAILAANEMIRQGRYLHAINLLDEGIRLIGDSYIFDGLEDDTNQKLLLSDVEKEKGKLTTAAALKFGVLASRLEAYRVAKRRK